MKNEYVKATRKQIIAALQEQNRNISSRIDKMDLHREYKFYLVEDAQKASREERYKYASTMVHCKVYVTRNPGTYGHQFMAALWVTVDGKWFQASGSITGGCGYDKISSAVAYAVDAIGLGADLVGSFGGTGQHEQALNELAGVLAGRKAWFQG